MVEHMTGRVVCWCLNSCRSASGEHCKCNVPVSSAFHHSSKIVGIECMLVARA